MIQPEQIEPGDVVLFRYAKPGILWKMVEHVQGRMLEDLGYTLPVAEHYRGYTHAAMVSPDCGGVCEMTSPRARFRAWEDIPDGTILLFRRAIYPGGEEVSSSVRYKASQMGAVEASQGHSYPWRELLSYWVWSLWWGKLTLGRRFRRLFSCQKRDVCSGSVWRWLYDSGAFRCLAGRLDSLPEAWYPARLAVDSDHFVTKKTLAV